ncbi:hypothetical protein TSOC_011001 [Tetrabaena socialis]|uniref:RNA polymerase II-associated protein 3 n=1 Tax=Tetrabaena socialis TaxID=47790 RepID=A0A2J7ZRT6_9CHLO|nr:hypothetical protein TSOC_011001 [Tetrabaena socialis]|eukprot:PNH02984.1 hypothetical protein TSOC_011001 [Tetrabaena socialis]
MAPAAALLGPLDEKEQIEFDNIRYDDIVECKDVKKLMRLEAYMRKDGYTPTADAAASRLRELNQRSAGEEQEAEPQQARIRAGEEALARSEVSAWAHKQRETDAALAAVGRDGSARDGGVPPVRVPARPGTEAAQAPAAQKQAPAAGKATGIKAVDKPLLSEEEAAQAEANALRRVPALRAKAESLRAAWLAERDAETAAKHRFEVLAWQAACERLAAADAAASAADAAVVAAAAATAETAVQPETGVVVQPEAGAAVQPEAGAEDLDAVRVEGNRHLQATRYGAAEACYARCLAADPRDCRVRLNLAMLLINTERWSEAEAEAGEALRPKRQRID